MTKHADDDPVISWEEWREMTPNEQKEVLIDTLVELVDLSIEEGED